MEILRRLLLEWQKPFDSWGSIKTFKIELQFKSGEFKITVNRFLKIDYENAFELFSTSSMITHERGSKFSLKAENDESRLITLLHKLDEDFENQYDNAFSKEMNKEHGFTNPTNLNGYES